MKKSISLLSIFQSAMLVFAMILLSPSTGICGEGLMDFDGKDPKKEKQTTNTFEVKKKRTLSLDKSFPFVHVEKKYVFVNDIENRNTMASRSGKF